jgi:hypothetical protein
VIGREALILRDPGQKVGTTGFFDSRSAPGLGSLAGLAREG